LPAELSLSNLAHVTDPVLATHRAAEVLYPRRMSNLAIRDWSGKIPGVFRRLTVLKQAKELAAEEPELPTGPSQVVVAESHVALRYRQLLALPHHAH